MTLNNHQQFTVTHYDVTMTEKSTSFVGSFHYWCGPH